MRASSGRQAPTRTHVRVGSLKLTTNKAENLAVTPHH